MQESTKVEREPPTEGASTTAARTSDAGSITTHDDVTVTTSIPGLPPRSVELNIAPGACARLVLTEPFTGEEFMLDRPSLVVGRTKDNDIVLNYKSISRHHAEIIRDGERYLIVDLRSANGLRVNGTEYKRVGLRAGDVVTLGHVRLRFDDPTGRGPRPPARGGSVKTGLVLGVAAAVLVLLGGAFLVRRGRSRHRPRHDRPGRRAR